MALNSRCRNDISQQDLLVSDSDRLHGMHALPHSVCWSYPTKCLWNYAWHTSMSAPGLGYWNEHVQAWLIIVEYGQVIVTSMFKHGRVWSGNWNEQ